MKKEIAELGTYKDVIGLIQSAKHDLDSVAREYDADIFFLGDFDQHDILTIRQVKSHPILRSTPLKPNVIIVNMNGILDGRFSEFMKYLDKKYLDVFLATDNFNKSGNRIELYNVPNEERGPIAPSGLYLVAMESRVVDCQFVDIARLQYENEIPILLPEAIWFLEDRLNFLTANFLNDMHSKGLSF